MAFTLQLIEGGTTTDLNDGSDTILKAEGGYTPRVGSLGDDTVTERATIGIAADTTAELDSIRNAIIQRLYNAKERQINHARDKTYVHWQADGAADLWRSEIIDGKILNMPDIFAVGWVVKHIEITIEWTRRNYWEGPEAQVPLTNTNGTDNTAGLNIYGVNDGVGSSPNDRVNYCDIKAADVDGDLPGATRLEMVNAYDSAVHLGEIWIGQNFTDPANHVWSFEAENATGGASASAGDASDGYYNTQALSSGSSFQELLTFPIAAGDVDAAKGQGMKAIIRFYGNTINIVDVWFKVRLEVNNANLWEGGRSKPDENAAYLIRDILTFNLPPWLRGQTGQAAIDLILYGQQETGSPIDIDADTLFLFPTDGWRYIENNDIVLYTERVVDDGIEGHVYVDDAAGDDKRSACVGYGSPIYLEPGKLQRLYFLFHSSTGDLAEVARYITVKLYYRPRRYTV